MGQEKGLSYKIKFISKTSFFAKKLTYVNNKITQNIKMLKSVFFKYYMCIIYKEKINFCADLTFAKISSGGMIEIVDLQK